MMRQFLLAAAFVASAFVDALPAHGGRVADLPQLARLQVTSPAGKVELTLRRAPAANGAAYSSWLND